MNRTFIITGEIDISAVSDFCDWVDQLEGEEGMVLIDSFGGRNSCAQKIISVLNKNQNITVEIIDTALSAAAEIFLKSKNDKSILSSFRYLMVHASSWTTNVLDLNSPETKVSIEAIKRTEEEDRKFFEYVLTEEEYSLYLERKDVYLSYERTLEICKKLNYEIV